MAVIIAYALVLYCAASTIANLNIIQKSAEPLVHKLNNVRGLISLVCLTILVSTLVIKG